jgi:hypothetical protein
MHRVIGHALILLASSTTSNAALFPILRRLDGNDTILGDTCQDNTQCPSGSTCIAGSAMESIQSCVQEPGCGGNVAGNCPGHVSTGQLVCAFVPTEPSQCSDFESSCIAFNGVAGIYKCMSIDRCDAMFTNSCSAGCKSGNNNRTCNGRGSCQNKDGRTYTCQCDLGWTGTFCDTVTNASCQPGVGNCGTFGECVRGTCTCVQGHTGAQCENPPLNITDPSSIPVPTTTSEANKSSSLLWLLLVVMTATVAAAIAYFVHAKKKQPQINQAHMEDPLVENEVSAAAALVAPSTPKTSIQVL